MSDFKAPEVVFISNEGLQELTENISARASIHDDCPDLCKGILTSYTLTSTVEEAKRKAARGVLEKVKNWKGAHDEDDLYYGSHIKMLESYIDQLLRQYQEAQPTEASDGRTSA